jgi:hypothetical protein
VDSGMASAVLFLVAAYILLASSWFVAHGAFPHRLVLRPSGFTLHLEFVVRTCALEEGNILVRSGHLRSRHQRCRDLLVFSLDAFM